MPRTPGLIAASAAVRDAIAVLRKELDLTYPEIRKVLQDRWSERGIREIYEHYNRAANGEDPEL